MDFQSISRLCCFLQEKKMPVMHTVTNHQKDKHFTEHNSYLNHGMCTWNVSLLRLTGIPSNMGCVLKM